VIFPLEGLLYPKVAKAGGLQSQGVKGEVVVCYLDPLTTQDLKSSGFPEGETTWENRSHPLNSPLGISRKWCFHRNIGNINKFLAIICHVVYATMGLTSLDGIKNASSRLYSATNEV